jgi:hypothetical protein
MLAAEAEVPMDVEVLEEMAAADTEQVIVLKVDMEQTD